MTVGALAVQGAFAEMEAYWRLKGAEVFEIRQLADLDRDMDLLALPGGESTVQGKLLKDLGLFAPLKARIDGGMPVFATCAGLINEGHLCYRCSNFCQRGVQYPVRQCTVRNL